MKNLMGSIAAKITAIVLSFITVGTLAVTILCSVLMVHFNFYTDTKNSIKDNVLSDMASSEANHISNRFYYDSNLSDYYSQKNILYSISDEDGNIIQSNYNGEEYSVKVEEEHYSSYYNDNPYNDTYENMDNDYENKQKFTSANITVYIPKDMKYSDRFSLVSKVIEISYSQRFAIYVFGALAFILSIALLSFLYCSAGHRKNSEEVQLNHSDHIPFDIYTVFVAFAIFMVILFASYVYTQYSMYPLIFVAVAFLYFLGLGYTMSFATRIKTKTFLSNNIIYKVLKFFGNGLSRLWGILIHIFKNLTLIKKTILILLGISTIELLLFFCTMYDPDLTFLWLIIMILILSVATVMIAISLQKIKKGGEQIAKGDLEYKIDTNFMYGDFKDFSESLNNINLGLQNAINEKMKSERFKTELITNVSHDIKTPLTSIINYVDLIKKENPEDETVRQYIDVLDRQSSRLKKLIEDLVEASKASTGNLAVNLCECEVGVLLSQTIGEFDEKLSKADLIPVLKQPEKPVRIMADGRHLWRVFDNLMNNVCKYSQSSTRVYMDVFEKDGKAVITFRNISKYELNISTEELMERFVRGDSSRNTEGSGLGLSIARSLVELQNGKMELKVDGDLFKVILTFDAI